MRYAIVDDGGRDVCLIQAMKTLEFLAMLRKISDDDHVEDPRQRTSARERWS